MKVQLTRSGGLATFPGLQRPVTVDASSLSDPDQAKLRFLLEAAGFFDLPSDDRQTPAGSARGADQRLLTLTVTDDRRSHTVTVTEPATGRSLADLLTFVEHLAGRS